MTTAAPSPPASISRPRLKRGTLKAAELAEQAIADFYDKARGTFWFQRISGEARLPARKRRQRRSVGNAQMARNSCSFPTSSTGLIGGL